MDKYCNDENIKTDFIKIDAEGADYEILLGTNNTLKKYHPIISIESGTENTNSLITKFLQDKNYSYNKLVDGNLIFIPNRLR